MRLLAEKLKEFYVSPNRYDLEPGIKWIAENKPDVYDAHTIGKGSNEDALKALDNILSGNIDADRTFYTVIITKPSTALAFGMGGSEYGPFTYGYCTLLSHPGKMLEQDGVYAVLVANIWERHYMTKFTEKYPNIVWVTNESVNKL